MSTKNPHAQALGKLGGLARKAKLTKKQLSAIGRKGRAAGGGWPKGTTRGPSPLQGLKRSQKPWPRRASARLAAIWTRGSGKGVTSVRLSAWASLRAV